MKKVRLCLFLALIALGCNKGGDGGGDPEFGGPVLEGEHTITAEEFNNFPCTPDVRSSGAASKFDPQVAQNLKMTYDNTSFEIDGQYHHTGSVSIVESVTPKFIRGSTEGYDSFSRNMGSQISTEFVCVKTTGKTEKDSDRVDCKQGENVKMTGSISKAASTGDAKCSIDEVMEPVTVSVPEPVASAAPNDGSGDSTTSVTPYREHIQTQITSDRPSNKITSYTAGTYHLKNGRGVLVVKQVVTWKGKMTCNSDDAGTGVREEVVLVAKDLVAEGQFTKSACSRISPYTSSYAKTSQGGVGEHIISKYESY